MRKWNLIGSCVWLALAVFIIAESMRIGIGGFRNPDAGLFPIFNAVLLALFSLLLLGDSIFRRREKGEKAVWPKDINWKNLLLTLAALLVYALILEKAGYVLTTFLFILFLSRAIEPQKWTVAFAGALATAGLSYLIFEVWLQTQLPDGVVFTWFRKIL